jgi:VWFA-related protein
MRPVLGKSCLILTVSILFASFVWAQKKSALAPTPAQVPIRDFSSVDRAKDHTIEYQEFDKHLLTFSTKVQYVLVPVVVIDKAGNPVAGLKKEDFRLQENGKDQVISSLEEIVPVATPLPSGPAKSKDEATNEAAIENNAPRRLTIIAIDFVNTPFSDQARARQQVVAFLAKSLEPDSLYQVVAVENNGLRVLHDYTQSSEDLIATVKKLNSRFTASDRVDSGALRDFNSKGSMGGLAQVTPGATSVGPSRNAYTLDPRVDFAAWAEGQNAAGEGQYASFVANAAVESTLTAFQQIAERTSGIPGRKSLIWITGGFPFSIDPATARVSNGANFDVYQHVMQELSDQMIVLYPVDARGVLMANPDATMHLTRTQNAFPGALLADISNRQLDVLNTMTSFADMTGGRAYIGTNDTAGAIHSAAMDGSHYYLLSYPVDKSNRHAGWRKIGVKVGSYNVRARTGYYLTQTTVDPLTSARFDIDAALRSPLDCTGIPLRVAVKPQIEADGKKKLPFSGVIPAAGIKVDTADNNHVFLEISYAVLTADGNTASKQDKSYNLNLNADQVKQLATMGLGFADTLDLAPGANRLRVVVRDNLNGRVGSVLADLHAE